jgi:hypothetical protein
MIRPYCGLMEETREPTCELKVQGGWQPITLKEALLNRSRPKRCPVCHGRVRAHHVDHNGMAPHFEHYEADDGCYLSENFDGNPRPHRKAIK